MIKIIENDFDKELFNSKAQHPLQSWEWGEARKKMGIEVLRIGEFTNKQISNVYQITFHKIPYTRLKIGYLPRSVWPSKEVIDFLQEYGKTNNVIFVKLEPYVLKSEIRNPQLTHNKLIESRHPLFPNWTQILDLTKTEDELLRNMKSKTRYNINLAQRKGVTVNEISNKEGFKIFAKLYFETCKRQKYFGHLLNYHRIVWENLNKNIAHILIAFYKKIPLAAYELFYFNKIIYYPYGGTSLEHRNFMASNLLMWEAIKFGKKLGAEKFDMWGSLEPNYNSNHPWSGFTRFKEGFGGTFTELVGSYDLIIKNIPYSLYNFLHSLRRIYLDLRR